MGRRAALTALATATVVGVLGCGGAGKRHHASDPTAYRAVTVRATFEHNGLRLKDKGHLTLNSAHHAQDLAYSVTPHVTASGAPRGGLYFEVFIFPNAPAAKRALSGPYVAELKSARKPWRRLSNVALVASAPVTRANRNRTVWHKAVTALQSLAH